MTPDAMQDAVSEIQSYLKTNLDEALRDKDDSSASQYTFAINLFSPPCDPLVVVDRYLNHKANGDVNEASKYFAALFDCFLVPLSKDSQLANKLGLTQAINQIREEQRNLTSELKSQYLKLRTSATPAALVSRQSQSVVQSPMLSPRIKSNSEDKTSTRDSASKLDCQLHSSNRIIFYNQLFDNLPLATKRRVLNFPLTETDNPLEACRLMMLNLTIFNEDIKLYATRLLQTLIDVSSSSKLNQQQAAESSDIKPPNQQFINPRTTMMCRYARSLLVLDAIPLVVSLANLSEIDLNIGNLFEQTLSFYSENCLENCSSDYELNELHEGVKKTITARILGIEHNHSTSKDSTEDLLTASLALLCQKFIETSVEGELREKLEAIRTNVFDRSSFSSHDRKSSLLDLVVAIDLEAALYDKDVPSSARASQPSPTPPPKGRGRPKKKPQQAVPSVSDDEAKKTPEDKLKIGDFIFYSVLQHMFVNFMNYLKYTRSRIMIDFDNPLVAQIESELAKNTTQRASRSKSSQPTSETGPNPAKRIKGCKSSNTPILGRGSSVLKLENSPLFTKQSRLMDRSLLESLIEANKCFEFLKSPDRPILAKLWQDFSQSNNILDHEWFKRFSVDTSLISNEHEKLADLLESLLYPKEDSNKKDATDSSAMSVNASTQPTELRRLVQLISCRVQQAHKTNTFKVIDELLSKMKHSGMLAHDENYSNGNIILEYMVKVTSTHQTDRKKEDESIGFLFFDTLSLMRYCVDVLMDLLERYTENQNTLSDAAIGHTIVLSQFDWPKEVETYVKCIDWIRGRKPRSTTPQYLSATTKFTYPEFFRFVRNPNLIEDFMALLRQGYTLDIRDTSADSSSSLPGNILQNSSIASSKNTTSGGSSAGVGSTGSSTRAGKAITTRGTNKSFKEDLKVAMITQMKGSNSLIPLGTISEFIQTSLIPYFML